MRRNVKMLVGLIFIFVVFQNLFLFSNASTVKRVLWGDGRQMINIEGSTDDGAEDPSDKGKPSNAANVGSIGSDKSTDYKSVQVQRIDKKDGTIKYRIQGYKSNLDKDYSIPNEASKVLIEESVPVKDANATPLDILTSLVLPLLIAGTLGKLKSDKNTKAAFSSAIRKKANINTADIKKTSWGDGHEITAIDNTKSGGLINSDEKGKPSSASVVGTIGSDKTTEHKAVSISRTDRQDGTVTYIVVASKSGVNHVGNIDYSKKDYEAIVQERVPKNKANGRTFDILTKFILPMIAAGTLGLLKTNQSVKDAFKRAISGQYK